MAGIIHHGHSCEQGRGKMFSKNIRYTVTTGEGTEEQIDVITDVSAKAEERQISLVNAYGSILKKIHCGGS